MGEGEALGEEELMEVLGLGDIFGFAQKSTINGGLEMVSFGKTFQKSSDSSSLSSLSSSPPSITKPSTKTSFARNSKKVEPGGGGGRNTTSGCGGATTCSSSKKPRTGNAGSSGGTMVRKTRLGDRITALQQLVSPFGKSDTASVLHEALGYIRFLHDQVQVLSSPYMQRQPHVHDGRGDLRSRGLCLVPISCTEQMGADSNGAVIWSPAVTVSLGMRSSSTDHSN